MDDDIKLEPIVPENIDQSSQVNKLFEALSKAQKEIGTAHKDKSNPFFRSKYADLTACWDACRDPLSKNGLCIIQIPGKAEKGMLKLTTMLGHSSGQFIKSHCYAPLTKNDPQGFGSTLTYLRRYGLCAIAGISPADDDGNAGSMGSKPKVPVKKKESSAVSQPKTSDGF